MPENVCYHSQVLKKPILIFVRTKPDVSLLEENIRTDPMKCEGRFSRNHELRIRFLPLRIFIGSIARKFPMCDHKKSMLKMN
jgi:hypothetical protein